MRTAGIYKIVNVINNKIYVGSAVNLVGRKHTHFSLLRNNKHPNKHIQSAFNKYGSQNFYFEIIEYIPTVKDKLKFKDILLSREQYWIIKLNVCDKNVGYNKCPIAGSVLGSTRDENYVHHFKGKKRSEHVKKKISESLKGHIACNKGKKMSESQLQKKRKPVINVTTGETFKSLADAAKCYNISPGHISQVCRGFRKSTCGCEWEYLLDKKETYTEFKINRNSRGRERKVLNITTGMEFNSIISAAKYYNIIKNHISSVCRGKRKTSGGYCWKYIDTKGTQHSIDLAKEKSKEVYVFEVEGENDEDNNII